MTEFLMGILVVTLFAVPIAVYGISLLLISTAPMDDVHTWHPSTYQPMAMLARRSHARAGIPAAPEIEPRAAA